MNAQLSFSQEFVDTLKFVSGNELPCQINLIKRDYIYYSVMDDKGKRTYERVYRSDVLSYVNTAEKIMPDQKELRSKKTKQNVKNTTGAIIGIAILVGGIVIYNIIKSLKQMDVNING